MRFPHLAEKISARRIAADPSLANWDHFRTQVHHLVGEVQHGLGALLKATDHAYTMRKMAPGGDPGQKVRNAHEALDDALEALGKVKALSGLETVVDKLRGTLVREDEKAFGLKL